MDLTTLIFSMVILGVTGLIAAILLYVVSQIFKVEEDPRIDLVQAVLPGANCGGCGFAGCRNFAEACVKAGSTEGLSCPVGGDAITEEDVKAKFEDGVLSLTFPKEKEPAIPAKKTIMIEG